MNDIFISYSRRNIDFARKIINRLMTYNKDVWIDWEGIPLSAPNWWEEIKAGIESADSFIFIISPDSMASVVCNMELDYALELGKRVIPIVYQDVQREDTFASMADYQPDEAMQQRLAGQSPIELASKNWTQISHINWIFFKETVDFDAAIESLIQTVETDLGYVKAHTRYLLRAQEWSLNDQPADLLLFGDEIERAEEWMQKAVTCTEQAKQDTEKTLSNPTLQPVQQNYIGTSRQQENQRKQLANATKWSIATLMLVLALGGIASYIVISNTSREVEEARTEVEIAEAGVDEANRYVDSIQIAQLADLIQQDDPNLALSLAYEASLIADSPNANRILADILYSENIPFGSPIINTWDGRAFWGAQFSLDGDYVVVVPDGWRVELIDPENGETRYITDIQFARDMSFHAGGQYLMTISSDYRRGVLWDVEENRLYRELQDDVNGNIAKVHISINETHAFIGHDNGVVNVWDIETGQQLYTLNEHEAPIHIFLEDSRSDGILSIDDNNQIIRWDAVTQDVQAMFAEDQMVPGSFPISAGQYLITVLTDHSIRVRNIETGDIVQTFSEHTEPIRSVSVSPDQRYILSLSDDDTLILWDVDAGIMSRRYPIIGDVTQVNMVAFSPDAQLAAYDAPDNTIIVIDLESGTVIRNLQGHRSFSSNGNVASVGFHPDGTTLLSSSLEEMILWRVDSIEQLQYLAQQSGFLQELTCEQRFLYNLDPCIEGNVPPSELVSIVTPTPYPITLPENFTPVP